MMVKPRRTRGPLTLKQAVRFLMRKSGCNEDEAKQVIQRLLERSELPRKKTPGTRGRLPGEVGHGDAEPDHPGR